MPKCGIYCIINKITGKWYIGSSVDIFKRWRTHKSFLNKNNHENEYLQYAWNKYGSEGFEFRILELVFNKNNLVNVEQLWLNWANSNNRKFGYNISPTAANCLGVKHTEESKLKRAKARTGITYISLEARARMSAAMIGNKRGIGKRKPRSAEHSRKISLANTGKKQSLDTVIKRLSTRARNANG